MTDQSEYSQEVYDVAIVGGGFIGGALANLLAEKNFKVIVIDAAKAETQTERVYDGRSFAVARASRWLLQSAGVWDDELTQHAQPIKAIRVADGHPVRGISSKFVHFDEQDRKGEESFGHNIDNLEIRLAIHRGLARRLDCNHKHQLTWLPGRRVISIQEEPQYGVLYLEDQNTIKSRIVIACDGRNSLVRKFLKIDTTHWSYGQNALVTTVKTERSHNGTAVELFMPNGPFAMLPLIGKDNIADGNRINIVWVEPKRKAEAIHKQADDIFMQALNLRFGQWLGGITLDSPRYCYPLQLSHARSYGHGRFVLAGDAAHSIHPLAGQGVNLGFRDIAALAKLLEEARSLGLDLGNSDIAKNFERARRADNQTMIIATDMLNRLFSNDFFPLRVARNLGMGAVNNMPQVKQLFAQQAMGLYSSEILEYADSSS